MEKKDIGILIKKIRQEQGMTQTKLAEILGVGKSLICDWEHGRKEPTGSKMINILQKLNICVCDEKEKKSV